MAQTQISIFRKQRPLTRYSPGPGHIVAATKFVTVLSFHHSGKLSYNMQVYLISPRVTWVVLHHKGYASPAVAGN